MLNSEYQRGLEAAAQECDRIVARITGNSQMAHTQRAIASGAAAAIRGLTPQEVCPTCGSAEKGIFDASSANPTRRCWAKFFHDSWHDGGLTPTPTGRDMESGLRVILDLAQERLDLPVCERIAKVAKGALSPVQPEMCPNCESTVKKDVYFMCRETPHAWHVEAAGGLTPQPLSTTGALKNDQTTTGCASAIMASPAFKAGQAATRKMLDWEPATPPTPQPELEKLVAAVQEFLKHDGGPGSENYDASKIYQARRAMQSAFGFRCPRCGETLPHLYDENCTDYRRAGVPVEPQSTHPVGMQVALKSLLLMCRAVHKTYAESNSESELPGANGRTFDENIRYAGQVLNDFYSSALAGVEQPTTKEAKWISVETKLPEYDTDVILGSAAWPRVYLGYWRHSEEWIGRYRAEDREGPLPDTNPTHWQPLPAPPSGLSAAKEER